MKFLSYFYNKVYYTPGAKKWYFRGRLHRENGPAIEYVDGSEEWWVKGKLITVKYKKYYLFKKKNGDKIVILEDIIIYLR